MEEVSILRKKDLTLKCSNNLKMMFWRKLTYINQIVYELNYEKYIVDTIN